jgi:serine/threonine-protein phosphatase 6 regulatory ankyrin repeat subunit A/serine/threonine-protein phosphatase 6 regulatory ankyrin repeat subunit B
MTDKGDLLNLEDESLKRLNHWLVEAVSTGSLEFTKLFLEKGADVKVRDGDKTLLMIAARLESEVGCKIAELLIAKEADIYARDNKGRTALMFATLCNNINFIRLLLKHRADINAVDDEGQSALLLSYHQEKETADFLVSQGADLSIKDKHGQNILMLSATLGSPETCEFFLSKGCNPYDKDNEGQNALMIAVGSKNTKAVEFFISIKMDLDTVNKYGETPLMAAADMGDLELCTLLVDHGANVNAKDNCGRTALIAAGDKAAVVDFLLHKNAYHHVKHDNGYTALAFAKCNKFKETIKVLKKFGVKK